MTQVTAMESMNPTFVTVEIGGNEILSAQVGRLVAGETFTPYEEFRKHYRDIVWAVKKTGAQALLVSIGTDIRKFPAIRTGPEIASQRFAFAQFNVRVSEDCDASENFLFVRGIIPTALQSGAAYRAMGLGQYTLSCADRPDTDDYILTPADVEFINDLAAQMSAEIERQAHSRGYATFPLGALYNTAKDGVPFNLFAYLTSPTPYGELISLDGVHPSAKGAAVLADAAAKAIHATYGVGAMAGQN
jgi:lysophospholipase L1-like esterase